VLLRVERELRRRDGEHPGLEEYALRFPQYAELIRAMQPLQEDDIPRVQSDLGMGARQGPPNPYPVPGDGGFPGPPGGGGMR
jgi:hypothetical protein